MSLICQLTSEDIKQHYLPYNAIPLIFLSYYTFPILPLFARHTHAQTPTLHPQNPWLSRFLTLRPSHLEQSPPRHQALCYSLFLQMQTQDISFHRTFQLSNIVAGACIFCIVTFEHLSTLCIYIFIADNISISMYILCVILCLFSALSRRVCALQIFIIIIIKIERKINWSPNFFVFFFFR